MLQVCRIQKFNMVRTNTLRYLERGMGTKCLYRGCTNAYRPLSSALEFTGFLRGPNTVSVLRTPDLILMERMILAVFLAALRPSNSLWRSIAGGAWQIGKSPAACERILCRLGFLYTFIVTYVPFRFLMGCDVRQRHWRRRFPHMGFHVKKCCKCRGSSFAGSIDKEVESSIWMPSRWHC